MKFNCGPSYGWRRMANHDAKQKWHSFFALLPHRLGGTEECRWLEWIERIGYPYQGTNKFFYPCVRWRFDYRAKL